MHNHLQLAERLATLLDDQFNFFGFKFGLDPIIGLIPGFGDFLGLLVSFYIVWIATELKLPQEKIMKMIMNIAIDFLVGFLPVIGDISDFVYKSNRKNLDIIKEHISIDAHSFT